MNITAAMLSKVDEAGRVLRALSNRHRMLILCELVGGEKSVGELAQRLGCRDSSVSQQLALLRRDRIVNARRDAQTVWYSLACEPARELLATLHRIYCGSDSMCQH
jgi:DNA-binding transcriptional ArsR family regulator